jgi:hypothetical protein
LLDHDAEHGTDYVQTLGAWLEHYGEPRRAAKYGIQHYTWLCLNAKEAEEADWPEPETAADHVYGMKPKKG